MARQLRIQYKGAIYHLMSRGDRREEIFRDDLDRKSFLATLGAACQKFCLGCYEHFGSYGADFTKPFWLPNTIGWQPAIQSRGDR
jgi:hypothetical protein